MDMSFSVQKEFFHAIDCGRFDLFQNLLTANPNLCRSTIPETGETAVHRVAQNQDISDQTAFKMLHLLVMTGAPHDALNINGQTPTDLACSPVRRNLLQHGFHGSDLDRWREHQAKQRHDHDPPTP